MSRVLGVLAASVTTFAATNLDDLFLLTVFFARRVATRRIVAGQYLGFAAIVLISVAGVLAAGAAVPHSWIRLLGIFPLVHRGQTAASVAQFQTTSPVERNGALSVFFIAVITLANGADNIGVHVPFFFRQSIAPPAGSADLWLLGACVVCGREMVWKPPAYSEGG